MIKIISISIVFSFLCAPLLANKNNNLFLKHKYNTFDGEIEEGDNYVFSRNKTFINPFIGIPNAFKNNWKSFEELGNYKHTSILPLGIKLERSLTKYLGIFVGGVFTSGKATWKIFDASKSQLYEKGFSYTNSSAFMGLAIHLYTDTRFDAYASGNVGYSFSKFDAYSNEVNNKTIVSPQNINPIFYHANFGLRVLFTPRFGIFADAGVGTISYVNTGFTFSLGK
jgi:hypothetical protein